MKPREQARAAEGDARRRAQAEKQRGDEASDRREQRSGDKGRPGAESGGGDTFDRWLTIARGSAYTILAVVGVWGLFTALSSLRRVKLVERTLVDPQTEREAEAQTEAAAEVEEHGRQEGPLSNDE